MPTSLNPSRGQPFWKEVKEVLSEILLGTCGWSYAEWEGIFYPQNQAKLKQYASIFSTVEIDSTFYALPKEQNVLGWTRYTPANFAFSAKLPQTITHKKALDVSKGIEVDINQFLEIMKPLSDAGKLVCILVQLPPFLKSNPGRLESFLSILPRSPNFAVEFRHKSWLNSDTFRLLEKYQHTYTIVDEPLLSPEVHVTSNIAYIRWHGRGSKPWFNYKYSEKELQEWVPKVKEASGKASKVLGYFNNHFHGYAPENCLQMLQIMGIVTQHGNAALRRLSLSRTKTPVEARTLEAWTGPVGEKKLEQQLLGLSSQDILDAGRSMPDAEFSLREDSKLRIAAYVEDTTVDIDIEERVIVHRCPLWSESISDKKLCPHVVKVFCGINPAKAKIVLSDIYSNLNVWKFESRFAIEFPE
jgi:uncharacterized protein YecE (DUF72 family)